MKALRRFFTLILLLSTLSVWADNSPRRVRVVTSFSILTDMAVNIGGDAVEVIGLVGPDGDTHVFEPSPADVRRLARADVVIVNGLHFEGWLDRLVRASGYRGPVIVATQDIQPLVENGKPDPHAWQSLRNGLVYVENIRRALVQASPEHAAAINQRAVVYAQRIQALDQFVKAKIAAIPPMHRRVITSHDAFGYFSDAYGVEFLAPQAWSTESEPSAAAVARIIDQIKQQHVRVLFVENITDPRLIERIAREVGGILGGTLYSDALSRQGTPADTYLKMFSHNTNVLVRALHQISNTKP